MNAAPTNETEGHPMSEAKQNTAVNAARAGEEYVSVRLFKDNGKYKDDLLVCVNGESCLIQRGVTVQVKRKFLWAIQNQMKQDASTANLIQAMSSEFEDSAKTHHV